MYQATSGLLEAALNAIKSQLDGGTIYVFSGAAPASPGAALDMASTHTQLAAITVNGSGTGLTFDAASGDTLNKAAAETWKGLVAFSGYQSASTTLTPTFFRFCKSGDNGQGATTNARLQGTVGGPNSGADLRLTADTVTANGSNEIGASIATVTLSGG